MKTRPYIAFNLTVLGRLKPKSKEGLTLTRTTLEAGHLLIEAKQKLGVERERAIYPIVLSD